MIQYFNRLKNCVKNTVSNYKKKDYLYIFLSIFLLLLFYFNSLFNKAYENFSSIFLIIFLQHLCNIWVKKVVNLNLKFKDLKMLYFFLFLCKNIKLNKILFYNLLITLRQIVAAKFHIIFPLIFTCAKHLLIIQKYFICIKTFRIHVRIFRFLLNSSKYISIIHD